ncbi:MAG: RNA-binding S4 domain-containing protein [Candidatus Thiodiazotropha sp. (ex Ctena orbiculata)]|nr:RNA-binding S4 domain-containing protein [Candidatus Thiodiazotropha taylori]
MTTFDLTAKVRLDKWLWAARFFKTRQIAAEAINGGKVHLNGQRTKPGKEVKAGSHLRIHKGSLEWDIQVSVPADRRRPASEARLFYEETPESIARREKVMEAQRLERASLPQPAHGKPSKRDRRMIHRFTNKSG